MGREDGGLAAAGKVLHAGVTAVLAHNDLVALGLIEGLTDRGVRVPSEVSVIGVDDTFSGRLNRPRLTTVSMPTQAAGRVAVDLLFESIAAGRTGRPAVAVLGTHLLIRDSTAPPGGPV